MKTLLFICFSVYLFASNYPSYSLLQLTKLKKEDPLSYNRILSYQSYLASIEQENKKTQLKKVNFYLNQLASKYDDIKLDNGDNWATPKEFLHSGYGDCEDYAIIKYYSLLKLGFDEKKLFFATAEDQYFGSRHMVLCYFTRKNKAPLILDNLSFKILNIEERSDLKILYLLNPRGIYKIQKDYKLVKVAQSSHKLLALLNKVKHNN